MDIKKKNYFIKVDGENRYIIEFINRSLFFASEHTKPLKLNLSKIILSINSKYFLNLEILILHGKQFLKDVNAKS